MLVHGTFVTWHKHRKADKHAAGAYSHSLQHRVLGTGSLPSRGSDHGVPEGAAMSSSQRCSALREPGLSARSLHVAAERIHGDLNISSKGNSNLTHRHAQAPARRC
jgi:hypothetical protein